jgi:hypothetical protein
MEIFLNHRISARTIFNNPIQLEYFETLAGRFLNGLKRGEGVDISDGGIGLVTHHGLRRGDVVKLYIPLGAAQANVPVYCLVMWIMTTGQNFKAGLRFLQ